MQIFIVFDWPSNVSGWQCCDSDWSWSLKCKNTTGKLWLDNDN